MARSKKLFTIGYEQTPSKAVLDELEGAGVKLLVDVRAVTSSRRPGFSKNQLAAGLAEAGIRYVGLRALGTQPEGREANRRRQWDRFWQIVETRLATPEAELALHEAAQTATQGPSCLICYEADWRCCHRRRVGEILAVRHGFAVQHLSPALASE